MFIITSNNENKFNSLKLFLFIKKSKEDLIFK